MIVAGGEVCCAGRGGVQREDALAPVGRAHVELQQGDVAAGGPGDAAAPDEQRPEAHGAATAERVAHDELSTGEPLACAAVSVRLPGSSAWDARHRQSRPAVRQQAAERTTLEVRPALGARPAAALRAFRTPP